MTKFADTVNQVIVYIYFNLLMLLGTFFVINLILAVLNESFLVANQEKNKQIIHKFKEGSISSSNKDSISKK